MKGGKPLQELAVPGGGRGERVPTPTGISRNGAGNDTTSSGMAGVPDTVLPAAPGQLGTPTFTR